MFPNSPTDDQADVASEVHSYVSRNRNVAISMLQDLIRVPSDNPPGDCNRHANAVLEQLEKLGLTIERHTIPEEQIRQYGMISACNLIVRHKFGDGPTIALVTHGDVVPPGKGWTVDPYGGEIRNGWIYGRAATASKSDIVTYAFALLALKDINRDLAGSIELHITYDEEIGGELGPKKLLADNVTAPDMVIYAGVTHQVVTAHNGCLHLQVDIQGKSSHAARPEFGHDAIEAATAVLNRLYEERDRLREAKSTTPGIMCPTLVVGIISGGINTNVVPDRVVLRIDRRIIPEENGQSVASGLRSLIERATEHLPGIQCSTEVLMLAEPLTSLPGQAQLVQAIAESGESITGTALKIGGAPIYTDARHYSSLGIPTVLYGAGQLDPPDGNAHGPNEKLKLSDLFVAIEVVALACSKLLVKPTV